MLCLVGFVFTVAGSMDTSSGFNDGQGSWAQFDSPFAIAVDRLGQIYVSETGDSAQRIRIISPSGSSSSSN